MFPAEDRVIAAAIETMTAVAAGRGFEPDGGCRAYFAPSAPGIVPPRHIGKVWAIMLFRGGDGEYANVIAWGKVQSPMRVRVREPGDYDAVVAEGERLIAGKQARGYRAGYAEMLAECGRLQV
jgi:predicted DNA-binding WGR domain protein